MREFREIIIVRFLMFLGLLFLSEVQAHDGLERIGAKGCFPQYFNGLSLASHLTHEFNGVWHVYLCDDVAEKRGPTRPEKHQDRLANRKISELRCNGDVAKIWVVNCNEI